MLRFSHVEKLLDALPSLTEIFRLVSHIEHVPYALLKSCPCGASSAPGLHRASIERPRAAAFRFLCSLLHSTVAMSLGCRQMYQTASCNVHVRSALLTDFGSFLFAGSCHQLFTTSHRIPQAIMQVSQAVHERPEDKTAICTCVRPTTAAELGGLHMPKSQVSRFNCPNCDASYMVVQVRGSAFNTLSPDNVPELRWPIRGAKGAVHSQIFPSRGAPQRPRRA